MHITHAELIKTTQVTILATAHNNADDIGEWVDGLIAAKPKIERHFKKTMRPWCGTFTRQGDVHIKPCDLNKPARRNRPREQEQPVQIAEKAEPKPIRDLAG
jgi:hypothetical protein